MDRKKIITVYTSLSQAQEEQAKQIATQNPVERIKETVQLILRVFNLPEQTQRSNRIYIDKV